MVVHERPLVAMEVHGRFRLGQYVISWRGVQLYLSEIHLFALL